jgi:hypothetical protein
MATIGLGTNDHLLKARVGGWVTGKLSDVLGLFLLPLILMWAVGAGRAVARVRAPAARTESAVFKTCLTATALGFALTKTIPAVAAAYGDVIGGVRFGLEWLATAGRASDFSRIDVVVDPTDLLALPVLILAYHYGNQLLARRTEAPESTETGVRDLRTPARTHVTGTS